MRRCFDTDETFRALFITYSAGAAGLKLQVATHVLELDPCFNDATRAQAEARAVRVPRPATYEMRMGDIRKHKAAALDEDNGKDMTV